MKGWFTFVTPIFGRLTAAAVILPLSISASLAGNFDGKWTGKWGGKAPAEIRISNNKVTSYNFRGKYQFIGATTVSGDKLTFGQNYVITLRLTGANSAKASYSGFGQHASASLTRS